MGQFYFGVQAGRWVRITPALTVELRSEAASPFVLVNQCPATLAAGTSCAIKVRFRPTSVGLKTAVLKVRVRIGDQLTIRTREVSGTGVAAVSGTAAP